MTPKVGPEDHTKKIALNDGTVVPPRETGNASPGTGGAQYGGNTTQGTGALQEKEVQIAMKRRLLIKIE